MTDPIWNGDYPQSMKDILGARLPQFTEDEVLYVKGSADFLGLNHYSSALATPNPNPNLNRPLGLFSGYFMGERYGSRRGGVTMGKKHETTQIYTEDKNNSNPQTPSI